LFLPGIKGHWVEKHLRQVVLLTFGLSYLLSALTGYKPFFYTCAFFLVVVAIQTIPLANRINQTVSLVLFSLGGYLLYTGQCPPGEWITALGANAGTVAMFLALPFFSFPLAFDEYQEAMRFFSERKISSVFHLSSLSALTTYFFSCFLNIGAFPIVYDLFKGTRNFEKIERRLVNSIIRANTAGIFWAPSYLAVSVVLTSLNLRWVQILPLGLGLSFLYLLITVAVAYLRYRFHSVPVLQQPLSGESDDLKQPLNLQQSKTKLVKLALAYLSMLVFIGLVNTFTSYSMLVIIIITSLIYPLLWAVLEQKLPLYRRQLNQYYRVKLLSINNEAPIFASVGFFSKSLEISGMDRIVPSLLYLNQMRAPLLAIYTLMFIMAALSMVGVHPLVITTAIATTITPASLGISIRAYVFVLLTGYGLAVAVSPFSGMGLTIANIRQKNAWDAPLHNLPFSVPVALVLAALIQYIP
jgi:DcuC family C4-dicarboxylate transporter